MPAELARGGGRGRSNRYNGVAIETCLVVKAIFSLSPKATEGFLDSIFDLMGACGHKSSRLHKCKWRVLKK